MDNGILGIFDTMEKAEKAKTDSWQSVKEVALNEFNEKGGIMKIEKDIKKHLTDLPDSPDQILVILKAHLLVEEEINRLLEAKLPNPDVLKLRKANGPKFFHKVCLLEALIPKPKYAPGLWDLVRKLNQLRNDFGHQLSPEDMQVKTDEFVADVVKSVDIALFAKMDPISNKMNRRLRIEESLSIILSRLVQMKEIAMSPPRT